MGMPDAGRRTVDTRIMSILCNAMQFKVQCRMPDPDGVRFRRVNPSIPPAANPAKPLSGSGDTPPSLVEGFEMQQLFGMVQRGLHVLFGIGYRLGADVLGAGANGCTLLLERSGGLLRAGQEFVKGLAGLLETRLGHRSHVLWNFETVTPFIAHGATPFFVFVCRAIHNPASHSPTFKPVDERRRQHDAAPFGSHRGPLAAVCNITTREPA